MNKAMLIFGKTIASLAILITTTASNSACRLVIFQPKLPDLAVKLKKIRYE